MTAPGEQVTLLHPGADDAAVHAASSGFPADLLRQSADRLRILALLYAFVFFMAGIFPALVLPGERAKFFASFLHWGPGLIGITSALLVAALTRYHRLSVSSVLQLGLVFEILSSYAIAAAEFGDAEMLAQHQGMLGLSWVAVWVLLFTVVVPTSPRRAVLAGLASVSAVPVVVGLQMITSTTPLRVEPAYFFLGLVFPYLLVIGMAYVGARVVYNLGTEVKRARELGSYRLEEKLGEGGMGEVWRARHSLLARPAAIKLIRRSIAFSQETARRFEREAQVIARLRSPHTVGLFDFGLAADGTRYYVMELLEGLDADSLVRRFGPLPPERVIHVLRQICHSLSEAHSYGLVHRDIKPANIFLCRYGEEFDFVKLLDFGIVRELHDPADPTTPRSLDSISTRENVIQGTPAFIAPEQALGGEVDGRADLYSVGCVAYWLLTGQLVFTGPTMMAVLMHHAQTRPVPPSTRTNQPISRALDELVLACLAKEPAQRPQSARELARRLAQLEGADGWNEDRARDWWNNHPRPLTPDP